VGDEEWCVGLLVLPADLPLIEAATSGRCSRRPSAGRRSSSPDGARFGTNALLLRPPDALPFLFGPDSFEAHLGAARDRDAEVRVCENRHLSFDLDTVGDLASTGKRRPAAVKGIELVPVGGFPEVRPGDDLGAMSRKPSRPSYVR
jgi:2-phospho-L-lactate guanylyltransferase